MRDDPLPRSDFAVDGQHRRGGNDDVALERRAVVDTQVSVAGHHQASVAQDAKRVFLRQRGMRQLCAGLLRRRAVVETFYCLHPIHSGSMSGRE